MATFIFQGRLQNPAKRQPGSGPRPLVVTPSAARPPVQTSLLLSATSSPTISPWATGFSNDFGGTQGITTATLIMTTSNNPGVASVQIPALSVLRGRLAQSVSATFGASNNAVARAFGSTSSAIASALRLSNKAAFALGATASGLVSSVTRRVVSPVISLLVATLLRRTTRTSSIVAAPSATVFRSVFHAITTTANQIAGISRVLARPLVIFQGAAASSVYRQILSRAAQNTTSPAPLLSTKQAFGRVIQFSASAVGALRKATSRAVILTQGAAASMGLRQTLGRLAQASSSIIAGLAKGAGRITLLSQNAVAFLLERQALSRLSQASSPEVPALVRMAIRPILVSQSSIALSIERQGIARVIQAGASAVVGLAKLVGRTLAASAVQNTSVVRIIRKFINSAQNAASALVYGQAFRRSFLSVTSPTLTQGRLTGKGVVAAVTSQLRVGVGQAVARVIQSATAPVSSLVRLIMRITALAAIPVARLSILSPRMVQALSLPISMSVRMSQKTLSLAANQIAAVFHVVAKFFLLTSSPTPGFFTGHGASVSAGSASSPIASARLFTNKAIAGLAAASHQLAVRIALFRSLASASALGAALSAGLVFRRSISSLASGAGAVVRRTGLPTNISSAAVASLYRQSIRVVQFALASLATTARTTLSHVGAIQNPTANLSPGGSARQAIISIAVIAQSAMSKAANRVGFVVVDVTATGLRSIVMPLNALISAAASMVSAGSAKAIAALSSVLATSSLVKGISKPIIALSSAVARFSRTSVLAFTISAVTAASARFAASLSVFHDLAVLKRKMASVPPLNRLAFIRPQSKSRPRPN